MRNHWINSINMNRNSYHVYTTNLSHFLFWNFIAVYFLLRDLNYDIFLLEDHKLKHFFFLLHLITSLVFFLLHFLFSLVLLFNFILIHTYYYLLSNFHGEVPIFRRKTVVFLIFQLIFLFILLPSSYLRFPKKINVSWTFEICSFHQCYCL